MYVNKSILCKSSLYYQRLVFITIWNNRVIKDAYNNQNFSLIWAVLVIFALVFCLSYSLCKGIALIHILHKACNKSLRLTDGASYSAVQKLPA